MSLVYAADYVNQANLQPPRVPHDPHHSLAPLDEHEYPQVSILPKLWHRLGPGLSIAMGREGPVQ
ncbi:hypothetical protein GCM10027614_71180 [Micromonospora vulcania]